jgi:hypothetical protein
LLDTLLIITGMILTKKEGRGVRFVTGPGMSLQHTPCRTQQQLFRDRTRHHPHEGNIIGAGKHVQESKSSKTMLVSVTNVIP